jgi:hypothetical protein
MITAISRRVWSSYSGYLYHGEYLDEEPEKIQDLDIVLKPFSEIYRQDRPELRKIINKTSLEYLRIKYLRGDAYIALAVSDKTIAHVSFVAKASSYSEYPILDKHSRVVGPCLTKKEFRGRGIYPAVLKYLRACPLGYDGLDIFCRIDNIRSQKGIEKAGFSRKLQYRESTRFGFSDIQVLEAASQNLP